VLSADDRERLESGMATVPALVGDGGLAVDARPLIDLGLLSCTDADAHRDPVVTTAGDPLFDALGDEHTYAVLLHRLASEATTLAIGLADDLDETVDATRRALDSSFGRWHVALWRLSDVPLHLTHVSPADAVLAPRGPEPRGDPERRPASGGRRAETAE
jgi:hypothetical protein